MNSILESCQIIYNKDSIQDLVEMLIPKEGKHGEMSEVNQMTQEQNWNPKPICTEEVTTNVSVYSHL